jgi:hypothetical protein
MPVTSYRYELRWGEKIIATGHLTREAPLEMGERISIGSAEGIVRDIEPTLWAHELHLVVQLMVQGPDTLPKRPRGDATDVRGNVRLLARYSET